MTENKKFVRQGQTRCLGVDVGGPAWARGRAGPYTAVRGIKLSIFLFSTLMDILLFSYNHLSAESRLIFHKCYR